MWPIFSSSWTKEFGHNTLSSLDYWVGMKMKIVVFCQAIFFCTAIVFTCYSVNERFFKNKVRACLMISKWLLSDFRHQKLYQKEICQKKNFLSTFPLFLIKGLTSQDWRLMDTQQCFGFLLVLLLNMEDLTGMVSTIHLFKVRLFIFI